MTCLFEMTANRYGNWIFTVFNIMAVLFYISNKDILNKVIFFPKFNDNDEKNYKNNILLML